MNSSVFSRLLKIRKVSAERVCMFREFHTLGAATGKARQENTVVAGGCCSSKAEADHRFPVGRYSERLLERYAGCPDRLALYVMVASLNVIRCLMGSQCNSCRASVAPAKNGSTTRVKQFWTR